MGPMDGKRAPSTLVNQWTSIKGAKGTTVVVLMVSPEVVFS